MKNLGEIYEVKKKSTVICPCCNEPCDRLVNNVRNDPKFYICFPCEFVCEGDTPPLLPMKIFHARYKIRKTVF